jgi:signal transduction histidine kinase
MENDFEIEGDARDLVREMSHAMRTPLTSVMGFSELLLEDETIQGEQREYAKFINDESRKLAELLDFYVAELRAERAESE